MIVCGIKYFGIFEFDVSDIENLGVNFWKVRELLNFKM